MTQYQIMLNGQRAGIVSKAKIAQMIVDRAKLEGNDAYYFRLD